MQVEQEADPVHEGPRQIIGWARRPSALVYADDLASAWRPIYLSDATPEANFARSRSGNGLGETAQLPPRDFDLLQCQHCSAVLVCQGCHSMHQRDHMLHGFLVPPRPLAPSLAGIIKPLFIPRKHLRVFPRHTSLDEHTCDRFEGSCVFRAKVLLKWHNLVWIAQLKLELHRVKQASLLQVCRPLQSLPLRIEGLAEAILQFAGTNLQPNLVRQTVALLPLKVTVNQFGCVTNSAGVPCLNPGELRCCTCMVNYCYTHYRRCGCIGKQPIKSMCTDCQQMRTPLQCKACATYLYFLSYKQRFLCTQCGGGFSSDSAAVRHEAYCWRL
jgi:hypothetical protein